MVDRARQVPHPSAAGWLIDLTAGDGPCFVVMRIGSQDALSTLVEHLIATGSRRPSEARALAAQSDLLPVEVVW